MAGITPLVAERGNESPTTGWSLPFPVPSFSWEEVSSYSLAHTKH